MIRVLSALALMFGLSVPQAQAGDIVVIQSDDSSIYSDPIAPFVEALGRRPDIYNIHGSKVDADALAARLRERDIDVVFATGTKAAWLAKKQLQVPVVYASVLSPSRFGIRSPDVAGVASTPNPTIVLGQFAAFFPELRNIVIFKGPTVPQSRIVQMNYVAKAAGLTLTVIPVESPDATRAAFDAVRDADAVWVPADRDALDRVSYGAVVEEARRRRIPLIVETEAMVRAGGMFAVVPDAEGVGQAGATLVESILNGQRAMGEVAFSERTRVVFNVPAATASGVVFDELMLDFVDVVIR